MIVNRILDNAGVAAASLGRGALLRPVNRPSRTRRARVASGATVFGLDADAPGQPRVGGVRQRSRGARVGLSRHLPGGRLLPPGRQHPSDRRGRPARRRRRALADTRHRDRLRDCRSIWSGRSACTSTRSTTSRTSARRRRPASGHCWRCAADVIYQAIGQALHTTTTTRQSRKGEISSWKAYAPHSRARSPSRRSTGQCGDRPARRRSTRARTASSPGCSTDRKPSYAVPLPEPGEPKRAILASYTKEHSAEYQAQAWIDLARKLFREHPDVADPRQVSRASSSTRRTTPTT